MFLVTTLPAPIKEYFPMMIPPSMVAFAPILAPSLIIVVNREFRSLLAALRLTDYKLAHNIPATSAMVTGGFCSKAMICTSSESIELNHANHIDLRVQQSCFGEFGQVSLVIFTVASANALLAHLIV